MKQTSLLRSLAAMAIAALAFTACVDDAGNVGMSILDSKVEIVVDSNFTINGSSLRQPTVQSRTITQILGRIHIKGYGDLSSTVVTQFMPSALIDTTDVTAADIDSVHLVLAMNKASFLGDSILPMGLAAYPLTADLPSPIYSDFDPEGKFAPEPIASAMYTLSTMSKSDSIAGLLSYYINVDLPLEFGRKLYTDYRQDPTSFSTPDRFINDVFKGLYIKNTFGSGRLIGVASTTVELFYHKTYYSSYSEADTTEYASQVYMGVTPEVVTNNIFKFEIDPVISSYIDQGQTIILSPAGYEASVTIPLRELKSRYLASGGSKVLNDLSFEVPVDSLPNDGGVGCPPYLLLIKASERDTFFAENKMTDSKTSFYAAYDSDLQQYKFTSMRQMLLDMIETSADQQIEITDDDEQYLLIPVQVNYETNPSSSSYYYYLYYGTSTTSSIATSITPYVLPSMARIRLEDAKIKFSYSTQSQKN